MVGDGPDWDFHVRIRNNIQNGVIFLSQNGVFKEGERRLPPFIHL